MCVKACVCEYVGMFPQKMCFLSLASSIHWFCFYGCPDPRKQWHFHLILER